MAAVRMRASGIGLLKQEVCSLRVAGGDQVGRTFQKGYNRMLLHHPFQELTHVMSRVRHALRDAHMA